MPSQGGIIGPQPRQFPSSQGGIIGPQPEQPPLYYEPRGPLPGTPVPQATPPQQYGTTDQQPGGYDSAGGVPYAGIQQQPSATDIRFRDTGPIRVRRFPVVLVIFLIVVAVGLSGFAIYKANLLAAPISSVQKFVQRLPFGNKDTIPPIIQNALVSNITSTGAVITWQTDEPATSQVMTCETNNECKLTEVDENLVTNHSVNINDLKPGIDYKFTISSMDAGQNQQTYEGHFTTSPTVTTAALEITGINVSNITDLAGTVSWSTDKPATTQVTYGTTNAYGSNTTFDQQLTTSHSATLSGLIPGTTYHFKVVSQDSSGNETVSLDQTFSTKSAVPVSIAVGPEIGNRAPDFTLPELDGTQVSLSDFHGKKVLLNFWQDVQQSRNELSLIQEAYATFPKDNLEVLAISWKQSKAVTQGVITGKGLTLPVLLDETGEVATKYNVIQCPVTIFIDTQGIVRDTMYVPATLKNITRIENILNSMQ
jgi:peroxiredoxin